MPLSHPLNSANACCLRVSCHMKIASPRIPEGAMQASTSTLPHSSTAHLSYSVWQCLSLPELPEKTQLYSHYYCHESFQILCFPLVLAENHNVCCLALPCFACLPLGQSSVHRISKVSGLGLSWETSTHYSHKAQPIGECLQN